MINVEIFSQGEEVVSGQTVDSNAAWLSQQLVTMGYRVSRHTTVGDRLDDLVSLLGEIAGRADYCICSGGLGPTDDDLTAEAVSRAFKAPLEEDPEALRMIKAHYRRRQQPMPLLNRKQALLPHRAERLDNHWGTAPGFIFQSDGARFAFVPGVPSEMRQLFEAYIRPDLNQRFNVAPWRMITLRTVGIGESAIQERLDPLLFPESMELSFRAGLHEVQTKLLFPPDFPASAIPQHVSAAAAAIGTPLFSIDGLSEAAGGNLAERVGALLSEPSETLALIETVSCGAVANQCANAPWLIESHIFTQRGPLIGRYPLPLKANDEAIVKALAEAIRTESGSDYGLAQWWSFDPSALNQTDQTLRLHCALATAERHYYQSFELDGPAQRKQRVAASRTLDLLRRYRQGHLK